MEPKFALNIPEIFLVFTPQGIFLWFNVLLPGP